MSTPNEFIKLSKSGKGIKAKAGVLSVDFISDDHCVIYIPSLNISSYGKTYKEAEGMMKKVVIPDFLESLFNCTQDQIYSHLKELGWEKSPFFPSELSKYSHVDKEGILRDFHLSEDTKLNERLVTV